MTSAALSQLAARLTPKQRAFANAIAEGLDGSAAYRLAYASRSVDNAVIATKAHEVRHNPKVSTYVAAVLAKQESGRVMTRLRKRERLATCIESPRTQWREKLAAIALDNRMTGDEQPTVVELSGHVSVSLVEAVRRQRMTAQSATPAAIPPH